MRQNQKGSSNTLIIVAIIAVLAIVGLYLLRSKTTSPLLYPTNNQNETNQQTPASTNQAIQSDNDITKASNELDNTDLNSVDNELNQNDSDLSSF